ncbi:MAG: DUF438 domain-containing protein [Ileibacterium sp.]|nr:DUF438 domain-containing protein [Ileibacterium sp.]
MKNKELKTFIDRLNNKEDLETVRNDFKKEFESVTTDEIIEAEQALMDDGMEAEEIQQLCDLHSALMHGMTPMEIHGLPKRVKPWLVEVLEQENKALEHILTDLYLNLNYEHAKEVLPKLAALKKHYQKKEELIMPILYDYGITGPATVMWGVDDEILRDLSRLSKTLTPENFEANRSFLSALLQRMQEMIYKENNILYDMAMNYFSKEDWLKTYKDAEEFGYAWIDTPEPWQEGEDWAKEHAWVPEDLTIQLPTGAVDVKQLEKILMMLPIDLTFIDKDDNLKFFTNEGHVFARPKSALGRKVYGCHPPRIIAVVEKMLADFKAKRNDRVERWVPIPGKPVKVVYQALYDENGEYAGTLEMVQSFEEEKDILASLANPKKSA